MFGWSVLAAVVIAHHPEANRLDRLGFDLVLRSPRSEILDRISTLGTPVVLGLATIVAALMVVGRDRRRALACLVGVGVVAVLVEYAFKPLVGRRFEGVLSYPSGNVADLAAVATAWAIAVPARFRALTVAVGAVLTGSMVVAVIGLRWHYPSDALAGAVLGVGTLLLIDGTLHLVRPESTPSTPPEPTGWPDPFAPEDAEPRRLE
ncbi:MAG TPA: phosphatase PAP2 family protein [Acidimicrobiales bacterium]|jgi:undecaprenyl-diphosphatase|nr:phosphatase PAP2 family protein [Acidimicrobiales bacterium]